ncbi:hypothetical protein A3759_10225 [Thalassolituus sp. HI0120]|nr:hypothetical protein A3759_10225 [Thalassolituus sp. HI0120]
MASAAPANQTSVAATQGRIWSLAWPIMLSNITVPLLGLVDTAILGHLDDAVHLGAVAVGSQLFILLFWSFSFLRMGTTALTARAAGAFKIKNSGDRQLNPSNDQRLRQLQLGLWMLLPLIPAVMLLGFMLWPLALPLMADNAVIQQGALDYLMIRVWATPAVLGQYVLLGWFIGLGKTRIPLILLTVSNIINAALNYVFVFQLDMTADGVALGTVVAEYSALILGLVFAIQQGFAGLGKRPDWLQLKPMLSINQHLFVRTLMLLSTFAFFTAQGAQQGELILAANAVLISLLLLIANALDGFAHAAEVLVGQSLGAKQTQPLRQAIRLTGLNSFLTALALCLLFWLFGQQLFRLLTDNPQLLPVLDQYRWFLFLLPLVGMPSYWLDGVMVGSGQSKIMRNAMIAAVLLVFYPLWWLFSETLTQTDTNFGLWWAFYAFTLARAAFMGNEFLTLYKKPGLFIKM